MYSGSLTVSGTSYIGLSGTGTFTQTSGIHSTNDLYVGILSGSSGAYNLGNTGQLSATNEFVGHYSTGTFTQTGGTHAIFNCLYLGSWSGSSGTYNLSGTGQLSASYEFIGNSGSGTFIHTGGTNTISSELYLGYTTGSTGTYNLSGSGKLSAYDEFLGCSGTSTVMFTHSGGTNTISNALCLGFTTDSTGTYNLSGSGQLSATTQYIGKYGTGTFIQTGGTNKSSNSFYLGLNSGSTGTYNLSGSGKLSANNEEIGFYGTGNFTQTGGTNTISNALRLGFTTGSTGTYNLSGSGQLSASSEYLGESGTGTFTQTGGTNSATYTKIGTSGTYNLSAGTLNINGGLENQGVWNLSSSTAVINMSSSILNLTGTIQATAGNATLNIDAHSLLIVPSGHNAGEYFATINNSGIIHQAGSVLDISSAYSIYGIGSIDDHVNCQGSLSATSGYDINLNGGLTISGTGSVNLRSGNLSVNDSISRMDGGSLNVRYQYVGSTGTGVFTQTGGTNSISSYLYLGYNSGSTGTYNLSGTGPLSASIQYIGRSGTGTFIQTGGTNTISSNLYLGFNSGSSGTYNLNSGTLILKSLSKGSGAAAFNFGGGTIQASGSFSTSLPMTLTGDGGNANIDTAGYAVTLFGILSGTGGLNKVGSGTLTLSVAETYSGNTTVSGGTLIFSGGINAGGTSLIDVESGKAVLQTTSVNKTDLDIFTAASATFEAVNGAHQLGAIDGNGSTRVDDGATLTVSSIRQGGIYIGSGAKLIIRATAGDAPDIYAIAGVPEPSTLVLLVTAFLLLTYRWARKRLK